MLCLNVCMFSHCMDTLVESSPCRRIHLLGIAHPFVGKPFQVLKVHPEVDTCEEKKKKKGPNWLCFVFCKFLVENPIFVLYKE